jgi:hypothetical protein
MREEGDRVRAARAQAASRRRPVNAQPLEPGVTVSRATQYACSPYRDRSQYREAGEDLSLRERRAIARANAQTRLRLI